MLPWLNDICVWFSPIVEIKLKNRRIETCIWLISSYWLVSLVDFLFTLLLYVVLYIRFCLLSTQQCSWLSMFMCVLVCVEWTAWFGIQGRLHDICRHVLLRRRSGSQQQSAYSLQGHWARSNPSIFYLLSFQVNREQRCHLVYILCCQ